MQNDVYISYKLHILIIAIRYTNSFLKAKNLAIFIFSINIVSNGLPLDTLKCKK